MNEIIVMIHGMWSGRWVWDNYKPYYEKKGHLCISPNLRYHDVGPNNEPHPNLGSVSLLDYADDLEKLIKNLGTNPVLIGHSMGGLIAQILANRGLADSLILLNPASPYGVWALRPSVVRSFWSALTTWAFWRKPIRQTFNEAAYSTIGALPPDRKREVYSKFVYESGRAASEIGLWFFDPQKTSKVDETKITCPTLIIAGTEDKLTPISVSRNIRKKYKQVADYREFKRHGHWVVGEPGWEVIADHTSKWLDNIALLKKPDVETHVEQRADKRINYHAPIILSGSSPAATYEGEIGNYSLSGIHFTSKIASPPGSNINIKLVDPSNDFIGLSEKEDYRATVIWNKGQKDKKGYNVGVQKIAA